VRLTIKQHENSRECLIRAAEKKQAWIFEMNKQLLQLRTEIDTLTEQIHRAKKEKKVDFDENTFNKPRVKRQQITP